MLKHTTNQAKGRDTLWTVILLFTAVFVTEAIAEESPDLSAQHAGHRAIDFDVVQNGMDFFFEGPVNENGIPAKGTPFVTTGYIYPAGTLTAYGASSGIKSNGDPEFPELVIGRWICRGWHMQDGDAESGVVVATTQTFDLDEANAGRHMIVTNGIELAEFNVAFARPITGASGKFRRFRGQMAQTYLDTNASGGFNMKFRASRR